MEVGMRVGFGRLSLLWVGCGGGYGGEGCEVKD